MIKKTNRGRWKTGTGLQSQDNQRFTDSLTGWELDRVGHTNKISPTPDSPLGGDTPRLLNLFPPSQSPSTIPLLLGRHLVF